MEKFTDIKNMLTAIFILPVSCLLTLAQPMATLLMAQRKASEWRRLEEPAVTDGVHIILKDGKYRLVEPLSFKYEDSGTASGPSVIKAANGAKPVISGGSESENGKKAVRAGSLSDGLLKRILSADTVYMSVIAKRAERIVNLLGITDTSKYLRIKTIIVNQYAGLNEIQHSQDTNSDAAASIYSLHFAFLAKLSVELSPAQIDMVKDGMTYGILSHTYNGYMALLPELNEEQKRFILSNLTEARELAIDKGSSEEKHEVFRKYKGRINNYLSNQGYDIKKAELELKTREKPKNICSQKAPGNVSGEVMNRIYEEIKSPYKYGLVLVPPDSAKKIDCPTVFHHGQQWYMTYLVYDSRGYETWLAKSRDLLNWETMGKILSFSDSTVWDDDQKAGYPSLQDYCWGGTYRLRKYSGKYWMSYFGGSTRGYERGLLSAGIAFTGADPATVHEWQRLDEPVLMATDSCARWWENNTIFKTSVIWDENELTGYPFVMFYNARGDSINPKRGAERIGMAVSVDMVHWIRFGKEPVIDHHKGISGDAIIQKTGDVWIMFYFGAFWPTRKDAAAFNRFACSYDLVNWTEWEGEDLITPSEPYDNLFAHKSSVVKYRGVVYHFYCAVNKNEDRGIALATSVDLGKSNKHFNH